MQATLLFWHIGLLTMWTDELVTYDKVIHPVTRVLAMLRFDVHPPLYFLLVRLWLQLPLPGDVLERIRMFSGAWTLAATILIDRLWLLRLRPSRRWLALALWSFSPAALLYGRMGRSYLMQTALAVIAIAMTWRFLRQPGVRRMATSAAALILLLYTHYVPGIAVAAAFALGLATQAARKRSPRDLGLLAAWISLIALGYAPWLVQMREALGKWTAGNGLSTQYLMTGSQAGEQIVKAGYGLVSFIAGECFPAPVLVLIPIVLLLLAASFSRLWKDSRGLMGLLLAAALIGYLGVAHWVSYPFIPPRLLWLLPFFLMWIALSPGVRPALRNIVIAVLLASDGASLVSYFSQANFLNKSYVVPLPQIAERIASSANPAGSLLLLDGYNTDSAVLLHYLHSAPEYHAPTSIVLDESTAAEAMADLRDPRFRRIWVLRNTHDISPHRLTSAIEAAACEGRRAHLTEYLPYAPWERDAMRLVGIRQPPTYFYQLTECTL